MDGVLMDGRIGKLWMCKKTDGHALGIVIRAKIGERFAHQLFLFRGAIRVDGRQKVVVLLSSILGALEGTARDIECDCCHAKRTWWTGAAGMNALLKTDFVAESRIKTEKEKECVK